MPIVRTSPKGQIRIPKATREKCGFMPGARIQLVEQGDGIVITSVLEDAPGNPIDAACGFLEGNFSLTQDLLALLEQLPVEVVSVDNTMVKEAADIKSDYPVSYADSFCVALAQRMKAAVYTNDPDKSVEHPVQVVWLTA
jgi:bifunctional DNA-binding transcriptional regulator/antitoxin component of YhaV-PrlF toxin-antitoxin module